MLFSRGAADLCYLVAFDAEGRCAVFPPRTIRALAADTGVRWEAVADLAASVRVDAVGATLTGVIWYRLPAASDAQLALANARCRTRARARSRLRLSASDSQPSEIVAINEGERDEPLPVIVEAT